MDSRKNSRLGGLRPLALTKSGFGNLRALALTKSGLGNLRALALTKSGFGNLRALAPRINSRFRKSKSIGSDKTPSFDV